MRWWRIVLRGRGPTWSHGVLRVGSGEHGWSRPARRAILSHDPAAQRGMALPRVARTVFPAFPQGPGETLACPFRLLVAHG